MSANNEYRSSVKSVSAGVGVSFLILIYFITLWFNGLQDLVHGKIDFTKITTLEWWYGVLTTTGGNIVVMIGTFLELLRRRLAKDEFIEELREDIKTSITGLKSNQLLKFNRLENRRIKKNSYCKKIRRILRRLDWFVGYRSLNIWDSGTEEQKKKNRYCRARKKYEDRLTEPWLEKNIDSLHVLYKGTPLAFITSGYSRGNEEGNEYRPEPGVWKMIKDLLPRFILSIGFTVVFNSVIVEAFEQTQKWYIIILNIIMNLYPTAMMIYLAIQYVDQYTVEKVIVDLNKRRSYLENAINDDPTQFQPVKKGAKT